MIEILLLALVFAVATWLGAWWAMIPVAMVWSLWRRRSAWRSGVAAAISWAALLALTIPWPPLSRLAPRVGGVFGLPGWAALMLPSLFALALGWSSARLVARPRDSRVKG